MLDLEELRQLQNIAKRPRVLNLISSEICNLEKVPNPFSLQSCVFLRVMLSPLSLDKPEM